MSLAPLNSLLFSASALWAESLHLPVQLVRAVIRQESAGNVTAWRVEPAFRYFWNCALNAPFRAPTAEELAAKTAPADFSKPDGLAVSLHTEWWGQQASWGPMQIMGAVARSYGFDRNFPALCDASEGVHWGALHLSHLAARYQAHVGWEGVAAAYNAGSPRRDSTTGVWVNQSYVDGIRRLGGLEGL